MEGEMERGKKGRRGREGERKMEGGREGGEFTLNCSALILEVMDL